MDTRDAIRTEFMRAYARERMDRITVKGLCAAVPVAQPDMRFVSRWKDAMKVNMVRRCPTVSARTHRDLIAEMGASAIVGAYIWWMKNPDAGGFEEAKRLIARAVEGVMSSI